MNVKEIFSFLKDEIHSTVFATNDETGLPHTCVIDIMLCDDNSLYFLTSKGKGFYDRLISQRFVAISGMKGNDTLSTVVVSVRGKIRELGHELVDKVFEENPYMNKIYPKQESLNVLTVFQLYEGVGEYFDLKQLPPYHEAFSFGGATQTEIGYAITDKCTQCGECVNNCPSDCIEQGTPYKIREENCIHCGTCFETCGFGAIKKR